MHLLLDLCVHVSVCNVIVFLYCMYMLCMCVSVACMCQYGVCV